MPEGQTYQPERVGYGPERVAYTLDGVAEKPGGSIYGRTAAESPAVPRFSTPNSKMVFERYSCPGLRMVLGKFGWFGESGKC